MLQLDPCIGGRELPIDTSLCGITLGVPSWQLLIKFLDIAYTSLRQALVSKCREFYFSDIKPTAMLRSMMYLKTIRKSQCFIWWKCLI